MKYLWSLAMVFAFSISGLHADDAKPAEPAKDAPKPEEPVKDAAKEPVKDAAKPATGSEVTKTGKLTAPSADEKDIVAVMHTIDPLGGGKKKKNKGGDAVSQRLALTATGDIATQLKDFLAKNSTLEITGTLADDKLNVTAVKEVPEAAMKKKKKNKNP